MAELHYRLWRGSETPIRNAAAVMLGVSIGCLPLYGAHLALCLVSTRVLRLSFVKTYLAAHINNPLTAPLLLYVSFSVGHRALAREWPSPRLGELQELSVVGAGRDLLTGSLIVGLFLGGLLAISAYHLSRRMRRGETHSLLIEETSRRYLATGVNNWWFVRGKLRWDPAYLEILRRGLLPPRGRMIDLGCGRCVLFAALRAAEEIDRCRHWPDDWPKPPRDLELIGVEARDRLLEVGREALDGGALLVNEDMTTFEFPQCAAVTLIDSLHYLRGEQQLAVVRAAIESLSDGGVLVIREADAAPSLRFTLTRSLERLSSWLRRDWHRGFFFRSANEWSELLAEQGLAVRCFPASGRMPLANVLLVAERSPSSGEAVSSKSRRPPQRERLAPGNQRDGPM